MAKVGQNESGGLFVKTRTRAWRGEGSAGRPSLLGDHGAIDKYNRVLVSSNAELECFYFTGNIEWYKHDHTWLLGSSISTAVVVL